ncbi:MAG: hypothetical protein WC860_07015 [Candidatus Margulisiibacteriota bacterium]|jgi:hypothetical protein
MIKNKLPDVSIVNAETKRVLKESLEFYALIRHLKPSINDVLIRACVIRWLASVFVHIIGSDVETIY